MLARSSVKSSENFKAPIAQIESTAIRLNYLVGDLRDLADYDVDKSKIKLKNFDLNKFLDEFRSPFSCK